VHVADSQKIEKALEKGEPAFSLHDDFRRTESVRAIARGSLDELRWYQAQIAVTAQALERSRTTLEACRGILDRLHQLAPAGSDTPSGATKHEQLL
jgi:hypothetical protein